MLRRFSLFLLTLMSAANVGQTQAAVSPAATGDDGITVDNSANPRPDRAFPDRPRPKPPAIAGVRG